MKLVIFDMDGTLIDSGKAITATINNMRDKLGFDTKLEESFIVRMINTIGVDYRAEFFPEIEATPEILDEFEREFALNYEDRATLYDGVYDMLKELKNLGIYIALATNGPQGNATSVLSKAKILEFFDYVIGANEKIPKKPDPTMLLTAAQTLKAISELKFDKSSDSILFVGDSLKDEEAAINAGIEYLQVTWGFGENSDKFPNFKSPKELFFYIKDALYQN